MSLVRRGAAYCLAVSLVAGASAACAQNADGTPTDLNEGKSPAQLFAADCSVCHARPQGLAKDRGVRSLSGFLRQHYTSSAQSADGLAAFLAAAGPGPASAQPAQSAPVRRGFFGQALPEPASTPASQRRGREASGPTVDPPSASNPRRGQEGERPDRPPRRVPDGARSSEAGQSRRPASAEAPKPAVQHAPQQQAAPAAAEKPKPPRDEIFD